MQMASVLCSVLLWLEMHFQKNMYIIHDCHSCLSPSMHLTQKQLLGGHWQSSCNLKNCCRLASISEWKWKYQNDSLLCRTWESIICTTQQRSNYTAQQLHEPVGCWTLTKGTNWECNYTIFNQNSRFMIQEKIMHIFYLCDDLTRDDDASCSSSSLSQFPNPNSSSTSSASSSSTVCMVVAVIFCIKFSSIAFFGGMMINSPREGGRSVSPFPPPLFCIDFEEKALETYCTRRSGGDFAFWVAWVLLEFFVSFSLELLPPPTLLCSLLWPLLLPPLTWSFSSYPEFLALELFLSLSFSSSASLEPSEPLLLSDWWLLLEL